MLLQNRLNQVTAQINSYLEEIAALQAKVTHLQTHAQEIQGAEQAAESALSQIDTAISMLMAICPEELVTFKAAIDAKFSPVPQIAAANDRSDVQEDDNIPDAPLDGVEIDPDHIPDSDRSKTIEVKAETVIDSFDDIPPSDPEPSAVSSDDSSVSTSQSAEDGNGSTSNGNGHHLLNYDQLKTVDRSTLIKLASLRELGNCKSKKRDELAEMLDGMVTAEELTKASNGKHA